MSGRARCVPGPPWTAAAVDFAKSSGGLLVLGVCDGGCNVELDRDPTPPAPRSREHRSNNAGDSPLSRGFVLA